MSNESRRRVRKPDEADPRVQRSTHALGRALIELVQERDFDAITVQDILDRAGVGRATFYAHFRNKEDVLHSGYERLFAWLDGALDRGSGRDDRLFPVTELAEHMGSVRPVLESLRASGRQQEIWSAGIDYAARMIERRLSSEAGESRAERQIRARMLAAALMESLQWWLDHPDAATPARLDAAFHALARPIRR